MSEAVLAWHFINADWTTSQGGIKVRVGEPLVHRGPLELCKSGLHASERLIDALRFARGPVITWVECRGDFIMSNTPGTSDKFVCQERLPLWGFDATEELLKFARDEALMVYNMVYDSLCEIIQGPPDPVILKWLETGDMHLRRAAADVAFRLTGMIFRRKWKIKEWSVLSATSSVAASVGNYGAHIAAFSAALHATRARTKRAVWGTYSPAWFEATNEANARLVALITRS